SLPLITTSSAKEITTQGGGNVFRLVASDTAQARALATYGNQAAPGGRGAIINEDSVYGRGVLDDLVAGAAQSNVNIVFKDKLDPKSTACAPLARSVRPDRVDLLLAVLGEAQFLQLTEALRAAGPTDVVVVLSNPAKTDKVAKADLPYRATYVVSSALD